MDLESAQHSSPLKKNSSWKSTLLLAYQSLGVVYGDLSISPLYVYKNAFADDIEHSDGNEEIFGVLSFVFWTLTLIPLLKYVFIVLKADDNGEGGTFALYSLICRHARVGMLPNGQVADEELLGFRGEGLGFREDQGRRREGRCVRGWIERSRGLKRGLLVLALVGTCMVIGDGVLTPAVSVFSAVSGLELYISKEQHRYVEVPAACIILICLFALQHYGTHRVGFIFAPIVCTWLLCISIIGVYNIIHWNPHVYQALSPYYMYKFLKKTRRGGWMSLGGILLCITGSEAMYADLGHFSQASIKIAFTSVVYPALVLAYMGQAAYISQHHNIEETSYKIGFYVSVPEQVRWPVFIIAILAAVVGSQAVITGTFSTIKQCAALGCFPRVKVVHTSRTAHGQIYIPEINWILMLLCLAVTVGFHDTKRLGNASGLAVITVMLVTTLLTSLVMTLVWQTHPIPTLAFLLVFASIEALFLSAALIKFLEGAWAPLALSLSFLLVMCTWHYGTVKKYDFDVQNKVSIGWLLNLGPSLGIVRVRGVGLVHTELVAGIPAIFSHFVTNLPAFHQVLVFLCVKSVPVPYVQPEERFLVGRIGPKEYRLYRVIVRYGYRDVQKDDLEFEKDLISSIAEFIRTGTDINPFSDESEKSYEKLTVIGTGFRTGLELENTSSNSNVTMSSNDFMMNSEKKKVRFVLPTNNNDKMESGVIEELKELMEAREAGMSFILGHCYTRAKSGSGFVKRVAINFCYEFLRRNSRGPAYAANIPHASTLEVGMVYHV